MDAGHLAGACTSTVYTVRSNDYFTNNIFRSTTPNQGDILVVVPLLLSTTQANCLTEGLRMRLQDFSTKLNFLYVQTAILLDCPLDVTILVAPWLQTWAIPHISLALCHYRLLSCSHPQTSWVGMLRIVSCMGQEYNTTVTDSTVNKLWDATNRECTYLGAAAQEDKQVRAQC